MDSIWQIGVEMAFGKEIDFSDRLDEYEEDIFIESRRRVRILRIFKKRIVLWQMSKS